MGKQFKDKKKKWLSEKEKKPKTCKYNLYGT